MKKSDIVERVAGRMGLSKSMAEGAVDTVLEAITEGLVKEEAVRTAGFGTFATRRRGARIGRNLRTGESVTIAASKAPSFKAGKALRNAVNEGWRAKAPDPAHRQDMLDRAHGAQRRYEPRQAAVRPRTHRDGQARQRGLHGGLGGQSGINGREDLALLAGLGRVPRRSRRRRAAAQRLRLERHSLGEILKSISHFNFVSSPARYSRIVMARSLTCRNGTT